MNGLLIAAALVLALAFATRRWLRRRRVERMLGSLPGARPDNPIAVASFDDIDGHLRERTCPCGGRYEAFGESSSEDRGRRLRLVRVECRFCERVSTLHFDVSGLFH